LPAGHRASMSSSTGLTLSIFDMATRAEAKAPHGYQPLRTSVAHLIAGGTDRSHACSCRGAEDAYKNVALVWSQRSALGMTDEQPSSSRAHRDFTAGAAGLADCPRSGNWYRPLRAWQRLQPLESAQQSRRLRPRLASLATLLFDLLSPAHDPGSRDECRW
jgi:hypothetical protein